MWIAPIADNALCCSVLLQRRSLAGLLLSPPRLHHQLKARIQYRMGWRQAPLVEENGFDLPGLRRSIAIIC